MDDFIYVGKIVNTHGIKGEVRILSDFDRKDKVFVKGMKIYLGRKKELEVINTYRHHKNFEMITMEGFNDINEILRFKGLYVYVKEEDLGLGKDEYLDSDLIGAKVIVDNKVKGEISDIRISGKTNKILEINYNEKIVLIPYNSEFVDHFDKNEKKIYLTPIKGMFE